MVGLDHLDFININDMESTRFYSELANVQVTDNFSY